MAGRAAVELDRTKSLSEICSRRHTLLGSTNLARSSAAESPATWDPPRTRICPPRRQVVLGENVTLCGIPPLVSSICLRAQIRFLCFAPSPPQSGMNDLSLGAIRKVRCEIIKEIYSGSEGVHFIGSWAHCANTLPMLSTWSWPHMRLTTCFSFTVTTYHDTITFFKSLIGGEMSGSHKVTTNNEGVTMREHVKKKMDERVTWNLTE